MNKDSPRAVTELTGTLEAFSFRNEDTGFAVARFRPHGANVAMTAVGSIAQLVEGQQLTIRGRRKTHPRFGVQLEVESYEAALPHHVDGIKAYLSSSLVKGIGPKMADRIVDHFGEQTLQIIEDNPQRLQEIEGLGEKRVNDLIEALQAQRDVQDVMVFLRAHGLGQALAVRIVKKFGSGASALIQANPYRLVDDMIGVGFRTADQLAQNLGLAPDSNERLESGTLHVLKEAARDGHSCLPRDELVQRAAKLLAQPVDNIDDLLPSLAERNRVEIRPLTDHAEAIYPRLLADAEAALATGLGRLLGDHGAAENDAVGETIAEFEDISGMALPDGQRRAVERALTSPVSIVTGGPGVGKTTIVRAIAHACDRDGATLQLCAPTGRAAKRLEESTGRPASTIHKLLEFQPGTGEFAHDQDNQLEGDVLVVDEASMLDVVLASQLITAVPEGMLLILVGDIDQLPSVGPGNVLSDLIECGAIPVTRLTEIFRQGRESKIVTAAHAILGGDVPESGDRQDDFFVIEAKNGRHALQLVREVVTNRIPNAFGLSPTIEVQVLCPMYRGACGADSINADLQDALNPDGRELERGGRKLRIGDKVMQIRNDYDLDLYNGDVGIIVEIDTTTSRLEVSFGERRVEYPFGSLDQLVPAHAITVHRSQGSEYPGVVVTLLDEHFMMLRRNLLYTAVTRGKQLVVVIATSRALSMAVTNADASQRWSGLRERIREFIGHSNGTETNA